MGVGLGLGLSLGRAACGPKVVLESASRPARGDGGSAAGTAWGTGPSTGADERTAVFEVARAYAAALRERDGEAAADRVVAETFELYADLGRAALDAPRERLEASTLLRALMILELRAHSTRAQLEQLDGRGLFVHAVAAGLAGGEAESDAAGDELRFDASRLHAQLLEGGQAVLYLRRASVGAPWRVDLPAMLAALGPSLDAFARERIASSGTAWTAFMLVQEQSSNPVDPQILDGPRESESPEPSPQPSPDQAPTDQAPTDQAPAQARGE